MSDPQSFIPPADLTRRLQESERRQDRTDAEVGALVKAFDELSSKLSNFLREYNQRSRTDWKAIIGLIGALGTLGTGAIAGTTWIIMTIEGGREERTMALIEAMAVTQVEAVRRRDQIDNRMIDEYRRADDDLRHRVQRLEELRMRRPD